MSQSFRQVMFIENIWKFVRMSPNTIFKLEVTFVSNRLRLFVLYLFTETKTSRLSDPVRKKLSARCNFITQYMKWWKKYSDAIFDTWSAKGIIL